MSMYAYVGLPRSGKSYNVVANVIVPALRDGRTVVSNVPVYVDKLRAKLETENPGKPQGEFLEFPVDIVAQDPERIADYVKAGCVFVLDEVWRLWPAGEKANKVPDVYKSIIAEHGHRVDAQGNAIHIVLVVQDLGNIGMFARRLVEQTFIHTKLGHMGTPSRFRVDIYHGAVTGTTGPKDKRIREMFGKYDSSVWDLYKSHTMSEAAKDGGNEKGIDKRGNVWRQPMFVFVIPTMVCLGAYAVYRLMHQYREVVSPKPIRAVAAGPGTGPEAATPRPSPAPLVPVLHNTVPEFRLVGLVTWGAGQGYGVVRRVGDKVLHKIPLSQCRKVARAFDECEVAGKWYGYDGPTLYDGNSDAAATVDPIVAVDAPVRPGPERPAPSVRDEPERDAPAAGDGATYYIRDQERLAAPESPVLLGSR
jgi:zona occludens toxin